jgi:hypothetical protein
MFMKKLGWTYETASDGLIAVSKHKESSVPFDVILMGKFRLPTSIVESLLRPRILDRHLDACNGWCHCNKTD